MIEFTVLGDPRGKGRPRFTRKGPVYTDSETRAYEDDKQVVSLHVRKAYGVTPRVEVAIMREGENHANG